MKDTKTYLKRPNKSDFLTSNQFTYQEELNKYYDALEKYADQFSLSTEAERMPDGKPLSEITDEDAIETIKLQLHLPNLKGFEVLKFNRGNGHFDFDYRWKPEDERYANIDGYCYSGVGIADYSKHPDKLTLKEAQFLQSKGYALPVYFSPAVSTKVEVVSDEAIGKVLHKFLLTSNFNGTANAINELRSLLSGCYKEPVSPLGLGKEK